MHGYNRLPVYPHRLSMLFQWVIHIYLFDHGCRIGWREWGMASILLYLGGWPRNLMTSWPSSSSSLEGTSTGQGTYWTCPWLAFHQRALSEGTWMPGVRRGDPYPQGSWPTNSPSPTACTRTPEVGCRSKHWLVGVPLKLRCVVGGTSTSLLGYLRRPKCHTNDPLP